jgi:hypothetical protein
VPRSITYTDRYRQDYFKRLAQELYRKRITEGSDDYKDLDLKIFHKNNSVKRDSDKERLFYKQKIHYLLYSGKTRQARAQIAEILKKGFGIKFYIYYLVSFFPIFLRSRGKKKGFTYE